MDRGEFRKPPAKYIPVPFWSLNDRLEERELKRQIDELRSQGFNGFYMHARVGLVTPYMGQGWMEAIRTCTGHSKARGMKAWLYDEFHCPSGSTKGAVTKYNPDLLEEVLVCTLDPNGWKVVGRHEDEAGNSWYFVPCKAHGTYVDNLNPRSAGEFIRTTYEAYANSVGSEFGRTIPGVFTDEPRYCRFGVSVDSPVKGWGISWSQGMPEAFRVRQGYDLLPNLSCMFFKVGNYRKIRHDYLDTMAGLFVDNYTWPIYRWCSDRQLIFTGHLAGEDSFAGQIKYVGAAMWNYEFMHIPGIDQLTRRRVSVVMAKQVSSVSHQLGKLSMAEAFGASGWSIAMEDMKRMADALYALGVNGLVPHLMHYSLRGLRKRDWPPSLFFQQPWWPSSKPIWRYLSRLSYALSQGNPVADVLVIHPMRSAWSLADPTRPTYDPEKEVNRLFSRFENLSENLLRQNAEYDYGDERLLARHGAVEGSTIRIGRASYSRVVIPFCSVIHSNTVSMLGRFSRSGGTILAIPPLPEVFVGPDGDDAERMFDEIDLKICDRRSVLEELRPGPLETNAPDVGTDIWILRRCLGRGEMLYAYNSNWDSPSSLSVRSDRWRKYRIWNPKTGSTTDRSHVERGGIDIQLEVGDSQLMTLDY